MPPNSFAEWVIGQNVPRHCSARPKQDRANTKSTSRHMVKEEVEADDESDADDACVTYPRTKSGGPRAPTQSQSKEKEQPAKTDKPSSARGGRTRKTCKCHDCMREHTIQRHMAIARLAYNVDETLNFEEFGAESLMCSTSDEEDEPPTMTVRPKKQSEPDTKQSESTDEPQSNKKGKQQQNKGKKHRGSLPDGAPKKAMPEKKAETDSKTQPDKPLESKKKDAMKVSRHKKEDGESMSRGRVYQEQTDYGNPYDVGNIPQNAINTYPGHYIYNDSYKPCGRHFTDDSSSSESRDHYLKEDHYYRKYRSSSRCRFPNEDLSSSEHRSAERGKERSPPPQKSNNVGTWNDKADGNITRGWGCNVGPSSRQSSPDVSARSTRSTKSQTCSNASVGSGRSGSLKAPSSSVKSTSEWVESIRGSVQAPGDRSVASGSFQRSGSARQSSKYSARFNKARAVDDNAGTNPDIARLERRLEMLMQRERQRQRQQSRWEPTPSSSSSKLSNEQDAERFILFGNAGGSLHTAPSRNPDFQDYNRSSSRATEKAPAVHNTQRSIRGSDYIYAFGGIGAHATKEHKSSRPSGSFSSHSSRNGSYNYSQDRMGHSESAQGNYGLPLRTHKEPERTRAEAAHTKPLQTHRYQPHGLVANGTNNISPTGGAKSHIPSPIDSLSQHKANGPDYGRWAPPTITAEYLGLQTSRRNESRRSESCNESVVRHPPPTKRMSAPAEGKKPSIPGAWNDDESPVSSWGRLNVTQVPIGKGTPL